MPDSRARRACSSNAIIFATGEVLLGIALWWIEC
jgi:hypothetical protein